MSDDKKDDKKAKALTTTLGQKLERIGTAAVLAVFDQFPPDKFNVLAPRTHLERLPVATMISVVEIKVNPNKDAKEVFPVAGGDLMLSKVVLDRIAGAAGISWLEETRKDDASHPHLCQMFVRGTIRDFDGTTREITGSKVTDLRADVGGTPGSAYQEIVAKAKRGNRDPENQLSEARKFISEIAVSKAKNRAIASAIGIKRSYSRQELNKPFVVPKLVLDTDHQAAQDLVLAGMVGGVRELYGSQAEARERDRKVINVTEPLEPLHEEAGGGADGGGALSPEPSAPDTELPPMDEPSCDPKTGETKDPPTKEEIHKALGATHRTLKEARPKFSNSAWTSLVKQASGQDSYDGLTWQQLADIDQSATAYVENSEAE